VARLLLIDGYNLAKALRPAPESRADALERDREALMRELAGLAAAAGERVVVIFD